MNELDDTRYCICSYHGRVRAYIVCVHILKSRNRDIITHHIPWEDIKNGHGEIGCNQVHIPEQLILCCEDSLIETGILLPSETRLT